MALPTREDPLALEKRLARLSADEMVAALNLAGTPRLVRSALRAALSSASRPLGRTLARFDRAIAASGPSAAAGRMLEELGAHLRVVGPKAPRQGALLVAANHPGAYDALALLAAAGRDDVLIVAADRAFLRSIPSLAPHLVLLTEGRDAAPSRARALRSVRRHLMTGGALLHFGAGQIEPDPAFAGPARAHALRRWQPGAATFARWAAAADGWVVVALVEGVHSRKAKRLLVTKLAEARGVTTLAPLLQVAMRRYRDVEPRVSLASAAPARDLTAGGDDVVIAARIRDRAGALLSPPPRA